MLLTKFCTSVSKPVNVVSKLFNLLFPVNLSIKVSWKHSKSIFGKTASHVSNSSNSDLAGKLAQYLGTL